MQDKPTQKPYTKMVVICIRCRNYSSQSYESENAYRVLGVKYDATPSDIKSAFRKLAKQTHPDLNSVPSAHFMRIAAAYQILSDPLKRQQYDSDLSSNIRAAQSDTRRDKGDFAHADASQEAFKQKQVEVVEWLAWYRAKVNRIVSKKEIGEASTVQERVQGEFNSAIRAAFYGPAIKSTQFLPECFEVEERSGPGISEILDLVSGRHLFGVVCFAGETTMLPRKSSSSPSYLPSPVEKGFAAEMPEYFNKSQTSNNSFQSMSYHKGLHKRNEKDNFSQQKMSDAYREIELQLFGKVVARATRVPSLSGKSLEKGIDSPDTISVFLEAKNMTHWKEFSSSIHSNFDTTSNEAERILLGTIRGLGAVAEEGRCYVRDADDKKTHIILLHRTLLVKHMHWLQIGKNGNPCECRCVRAYLPPSKFWIFEPRCENHDIGGWYVETYGHDRKGRRVLMKRNWQNAKTADNINFPKGSFNGSSHGSLHPAIYLMALAYRTLDLEASKKKKPLTSILGSKLDLGSASKILHWCKKKFPFIKGL